MKIKNLKCYGAILGCSSLLVLSGCGKKDYYLEDTILDGAFMATVNGEDCILKWNESHYDPNKKQFHAHYRDIVSGEIITEYSDCETAKVRKVEEITEERSITSCMSAEELQKAIDGNLTIEDLMNALN